jgi:hypothetical protein
MGRRPLPKRITPLIAKPLTFATTWGISSPFELLSPASGQVTNALLTRSPLRHHIAITSPFDLHVLSTPPAFILSQDQTLRKNFRIFRYVKVTDLTGITGFAFYHSSVVKVLPIERAGFYQSTQWLSRALPTLETRLPMPIFLLTSALKTFLGL